MCYTQLTAIQPKTMIESRNFMSALKIHSKNKIPPTIKDNTFSKTNYIECKLFVPVGSYKDYRQAMGWCEFKQIIEE